MNSIYFCKVQFSICTNKGKNIMYLQPKFKVLTLDENDKIQFEDFEKQQEHNVFFTPKQTQKIHSIKLIEKLQFLGNPLKTANNEIREKKIYKGNYKD